MLQLQPMHQTVVFCLHTNNSCYHSQLFARPSEAQRDSIGPSDVTCDTMLIPAL